MIPIWPESAADTPEGSALVRTVLKEAMDLLVKASGGSEPDLSEHVYAENPLLRMVKKEQDQHE